MRVGLVDLNGLLFFRIFFNDGLFRYIFSIRSGREPDSLSFLWSVKFSNEDLVLLRLAKET